MKNKITNTTALLLAALLLLTSVASPQTPCIKNLNGLTLRQFDQQYVSLISKVDRELRRTGHYIYTDATKTVVVAYEATATIDVTREHRGVVDCTICVLNHLPVPTVLQQSGSKLLLVSRIYTVF